MAVIYAPSEYQTWATLTDIYIDINDFESALLALNSCPMFTYCERDAQRMPAPARTHLPLKPEPAANEDPSKMTPLSGTVSDENDPRENEVFLLCDPLDYVRLTLLRYTQNSLDFHRSPSAVHS